jgi:hypothetical protein
MLLKNMFWLQSLTKIYIAHSIHNQRDSNGSWEPSTSQVWSGCAQGYILVSGERLLISSTPDYYYYY